MSCPHSPWVWMELLWIADLWKHRLPACRVLCVHPSLPSAISSAKTGFLLVSAINAAGSIRGKLIYESWANVLREGYEATVADLKKAYDAVVVRRKDERDTSKRWFGVRSVESSEVGEPSCRMEYASQMLLRLGRLNTCLSPYLLFISPVAVALQCHRKFLGKGNANEVRHPLPLLHPNGYSNLTTSQLFCQKEEGYILMIRTPKVL